MKRPPPCEPPSHGLGFQPSQFGQTRVSPVHRRQPAGIFIFFIHKKGEKWCFKTSSNFLINQMALEMKFIQDHLSITKISSYVLSSNSSFLTGNSKIFIASFQFDQFAKIPCRRCCWCPIQDLSELSRVRKGLEFEFSSDWIISRCSKEKVSRILNWIAWI